MPEITSSSFWQYRNVFVTGSTGLLGTWLTAELLEKEAIVTALVRDIRPSLSIGFPDSGGRVNIVRGELEDYLLLERALNEYEIDTVFHLGAQAIVGTATRNPLATFEANIRGTWNVLEACRRVSTVKSIIVASSDKAYGSHDSLPYHEGMALQGMHPYDVSKSCTDLIAQTYHCTYGLPVCITRCGNFFGGGDLNFNRIIPGTIQSILHDKNPVIRSDGTFIRDYIYVKDVVKAYLFLAEKMRSMNISGHGFNFSNEIQLTVLELTNKLLELSGRRDLQPMIMNEAKGEIRHQFLSAAKAREVLGWKPEYGLEHALQETIAWYRDYFSDSRGIVG